MLNYQILGNGEPFLLIHGLFGSLENLNMVAKPLSEQFKVISVDVRNHGASFHASEMSYELMANDVNELLTHLNIESTYLLGHSMGGKIAMKFALTFPEKVKKLVVADIAPVAYPPSHQQIISGLKAIDLNAVNKRSDADKQLANYVDELSTRQFLLKNLEFKNEKAQWRCDLEAISANYEKLIAGIDSTSSFNKPTLIVAGGKSNYVSMAHKDIIARLFPSATAKIIQNAGHWLHAEKPSAFNKIVYDFITA